MKVLYKKNTYTNRFYLYTLRVFYKIDFESLTDINLGFPLSVKVVIYIEVLFSSLSNVLCMFLRGLTILCKAYT